MKKIVFSFISYIFRTIIRPCNVKEWTCRNSKNCGSFTAVRKLVDIYAKDDQSSEVKGQIGLNNQDNYNIFYCKQNNWCEVVNKDNGDTGWISLEQLNKLNKGC